MKALMTLAAAAALLTGIAAANAQSNMQGGSTNLTATGSAWCLQDKAAGTNLNCKFASQADCQKEAKAQGSCVQYPKPGSTTGSGPGGSMKK